MKNLKAQHLLERIQRKQLLFKLVQKDQSVPSIYNRKEKSLEELSRRFLRQMMQYDSKIIYLDNLTQLLDVERRRLYDIINILESLKVVSRQCKNKYCWNGFKTIYKTIIDLKIEDEASEDVAQKKCRNGRKDKSLEVLSVGFLKLFNIKSRWTLEEAAKKLSSSNTDDAKLKTTIRRLYDIANVLKSIGLISRSQSDRKAGYQWIGEKGLDMFQLEMEKYPQNVDSFESSVTSGEKKLKVEYQNAQIQPQIHMSGFFNYVMDQVLKQQLSRTDSLTEIKSNSSSNLDKILQENINPQVMFTPKIRPTLTIIYPPSKLLGLRQTHSKDF